QHAKYWRAVTMIRNLVFAALLLFAGGAPQAQNVTDPSATLLRAVGPFLQKNCQGCHSTSLPSGSVDMQQLLAAPNSLVDQRDTWENIAYQLRSGRMPPDTAPKPAKADIDAALEVMSRALAGIALIDQRIGRGEQLLHVDAA